MYTEVVSGTTCVAVKTQQRDYKTFIRQSSSKEPAASLFERVTFNLAVIEYFTT